MGNMLENNENIASANLAEAFTKGIRPGKTEQIFQDSENKALTLVVKPTSKKRKDGALIWRVHHAENVHFKTRILGECPTVSLKQAREKAQLFIKSGVIEKQKNIR